MSTSKSQEFKATVFAAMPGLSRKPHTGNRWIVKLPQQYGGEEAILKTSAVAAMMTIAEEGDADAPLIGLERGVEPGLNKILAAMQTDDGVINFYLLDRQMVVDRIKATHRLWRKRNPDSDNQNRVLYFRDYKVPSKDPEATVFKDWEKHIILSVAVGDIVPAETSPEETSQLTPADAVVAAKVMVAEAYGIDTEQVRISVDL